MKDKYLGEEDEIDYLQRVLEGYVKGLKKPHRIKICKKLPIGDKPLAKTFKKLKEETGIPTGPLYNHLIAICDSGILKRSGWPNEYSFSPSVNKMLNDLTDPNGTFNKYYREYVEGHV